MNLFRHLKFYILLAVIIFLSLFLNASNVSAINKGAKISFTFDDGLDSTYTHVAPILAKYNFHGTSYVVTNCVGMNTTPNLCRADNDAIYMDWDQIISLQNIYGWEIASHTASHPYLATKDADDGQPKKLTSSQIISELTASKTALEYKGINVSGFSAPYGDYNQFSLNQISKLYSYNRGYADTGYNEAPYNDYIIKNQPIRVGISVDSVKGYVDQAIANNQWLVLTFHDVLPNASNDPEDYQYSTADFEQIVAYVNSKNIEVTKVSDGLIGGDNLLTNYSFEDGMNGWITDSPSTINLNTSNNGAYPNPSNSIFVKSNSINSHLFSPFISVSSQKSYILKNFINISKINSGCVGYYIDEYDINGNWISGQYKMSVSFPWAQTVGFTYKPTSGSVVKAQLQVIVSANSGIEAYLDNFQWIDENPNIIIIPETPANLIINGDFENGFGNEWSTDDTSNITLDTANNGSLANPTNSIKLVSTITNKHLFSSKIETNYNNSYTVSANVNVSQLTSGEIGFYMDEYNVDGNWISGQYITGVREVGSKIINFTYTPTSENVRSTGLQVILVANSNIVAYIDNIIWTQKQ